MCNERYGSSNRVMMMMQCEGRQTPMMMRTETMMTGFLNRNSVEKWMEIVVKRGSRFVSVSRFSFCLISRDDVEKKCGEISL
jgi:hypothetical protein